MPTQSDTSRTTNLSAAVTALILAIAGLVLLATAQWAIPTTWVGGSAFAAQLGGLFLASGVVTIGWDMMGRRQFARELMDMAGLSHDLQRSGLVSIGTQYLDAQIWEALFENVTKLDILVAYAHTWRHAHQGNLDKVARRAGAEIRVYLPDPSDDLTMRTLARRFNVEPDVLKSKVLEAAQEYLLLGQRGSGTVEVRFWTGDLVFSCYRFDQRAVVTLYSHTRERQTEVPTFVVKEGDLFDFVRNELAIIARTSKPFEPATKE